MIRPLMPSIGVLLAGTSLVAQHASDRFASGVEIVEVYATVVDARGEPVTGLREADFDVFENGERQRISTFDAGEFPLTVVLGVDRSWSMAGEPLQAAKRAARRFLRELRPVDRAMVVAIGGTADIVAPLSTDRAQQTQAIDAMDPWSTTALNDAMITILDRLGPEPGRQAVVVFSDGVDRYGLATGSEVVDRARGGTALIYPIALGRTRPPLFAELAAVTGGRSFQLRSAKDLEGTLASIARELRQQYLIGYVPVRRTELVIREWRSIRVEVKNARQGWRVRARDGYVAN